jgi:FMN phosphatase YigB (HAD superfamily)
LTAIIFDLDNCLAPADQIGADLFEPAFEAIAAANDGSVPEEAIQEAFSNIWIHAFDWVACEFQFTPAMFDAGWNQLIQVEVTKPMKGYADLKELSAIPADRFLVTTGFRKLQESKIRALGIEGLFRGIIVDAIDEEGRKGKRGYFQEIIDKYNYSPQEVLVLGDNPESEIEAGNSLGLRTIQTLRPGIVRTPKASHHISSLKELAALL